MPPKNATLKMIEIDSVKLIQNIEKYPCIWNDTVAEYQSSYKKDEAWKSVAVCVVNNWPKMEPDEKSYKLKAIKKRWGNIRDCYRREYYIQKNCGTKRPLKKGEKYIYTDHLEFMRNLYDSRTPDNAQPTLQINNNSTDAVSEALILSIEKMDCLWNPASQNYKDQASKDVAWNSLANELIGDWRDLNQDEKLAKLELLKRRWYNIKSSLRRELAIQNKFGTDWTKRNSSEYKHSEILNFLKPIYQQKWPDFNIYTENVPTVTLISTIKKHLCLWNVACEDYDSPRLRSESWNKIGADLIEHWALLSEDQRSEAVQELKNRWNNIKENFTKDLDFQKNGYKDKRKKKLRYKYMKILKFMEPIYELTEFGNCFENNVVSELLCVAIEKFPCVWDFTCRKYKNNRLKTIAWKSVAEELINEWHECSNKEKTSKVKELKHRWDDIKYGFKKYIDFEYQYQSRRPRMKWKKYKHAETLDFLRPLYANKYYSHINLNSSNEEHTDNELVVPARIANTDKDEDPDLMFLESLLPDMKALSARQKYQFKVLVKETVRTFRQKHLRNSSPDSTNSTLEGADTCDVEKMDTNST